MEPDNKFSDDAPAEMKMSDAKKLMEAEVEQENAVKRKGKISRKRKDLLSQLDRKIPTQVIKKIVQEEAQAYCFILLYEKFDRVENIKREAEKIEPPKEPIKGKKVYKKYSLPNLSQNRKNKFYMTLRDDTNEKEEAVGAINSFLKDHFYGNRVKRTGLSLMIRKK